LKAMEPRCATLPQATTALLSLLRMVSRPASPYRATTSSMASSLLEGPAVELPVMG